MWKYKECYDRNEWHKLLVNVIDKKIFNKLLLLMLQYNIWKILMYDEIC